jgi:citrate lyase subunit beta/citryl-CoA lyase
VSTVKPIRSVLYMPGSNERALEKAKGIPADALILDLEDAVAPDTKDAARALVVAAVDSYPDKIVTIRANGLGSQWHADDVAAIATSGAAAIVVPKVNSADEVHVIEAELVAAGAPDELEIWAMIESPRAVLDAAEIAASSPRLTVLVMGTNDLISEIRGAITPGRPALLPSLSLAVLGARAAGKSIVDGVYMDVKDEAGLTEECVQGRTLGFDGKTLIHPGQVVPTNTVFAPGEKDVEHARAVIEAFKAARAEGKGVATVNGKLIENLHVADAERVLAYAEVIAARQ